jgi:hypothetical protein
VECAEAVEEYKTMVEYLARLRSKHCTTLSPELRPESFPVHLWPYVFDSDKITVKAAWDPWIARAVPG